MPKSVRILSGFLVYMNIRGRSSNVPNAGTQIRDMCLLYEITDCYPAREPCTSYNTIKWLFLESSVIFVHKISIFKIPTQNQDGGGDISSNPKVDVWFEPATHKQNASGNGTDTGLWIARLDI